MSNILLPSNANIKSLALDESVSQKIEKLDDCDFNLLPQTCKKEILPHLAYLFGVDISQLDESEQRRLIDNAFEIYRFAGTTRAIKLALLSVFGKAEIISWQDDLKLEPFHFRSDVVLDTDINRVYNQTHFDKIKLLVEMAKSKRDVFDGFNLKIPEVKADIKSTVGGVLNVKLQNNLKIESSAKITIGGGLKWQI